MKKEWTGRMLREDLEAIPKMEAAGWTAEFDASDKLCGRVTPDCPPLHPVSFAKRQARAWKCIDRGTGEIVWMTARLIECNYVGHEKYDTLEQVIEAYQDR